MPADSSVSPIRIIYQDQYLLVVDKPAGIPSQGDKSGTADLLTLLEKQLQADHASSPAGHLLPVHRLDRPVSGLVVLARTAAVQADLTRQMASHEFQKNYHCIVLGSPEIEEAEITNYLVKNERLNITQVCGPDRKMAKIAKLHYRKEGQCLGRQNELLSLLQIELQTGRHHQIRIQLAHAGWPLWGDTKYNPSFRRSGGWHSLALCSTSLKFRHPVTQEDLSFSRPLPSDYPFSLFLAPC